MSDTKNEFPADKLPSPVVTSASNARDTHLLSLAASTITSETDGGYKQTRPRNTRVRCTMTYTWTCLTDEEMKVLRAFFGQIGTFDMFKFKDYSLGELHTVRFASDLSFQYIHPVGWTVTAQFEEV